MSRNLWTVLILGLAFGCFLSTWAQFVSPFAPFFAAYAFCLWALGRGPNRNPQ